MDKEILTEEHLSRVVRECDFWVDDLPRQMTTLQSCCKVRRPGWVKVLEEWSEACILVSLWSDP